MKIGLSCAKGAVGSFTAAVAAALLFSTPVFAGGYDTGERDWDFLFQDSRFAVQIGTTFIHPDRTLSTITGTLGPSIDTPEAASFRLDSLRFAMRLSDDIRCMGSTHQPYGGFAAYDPAWSYAPSVVRQEFSSRSLDLTCAYSLDAGTGRLSFVLGASEQNIRYVLEQDLTALNPFVGRTRADVSDRAATWRIGLAYEIPDYALRASVIYNSGARHRPSGSFSTGLGIVPVEGALRMPASVELRLQSGIAEQTLAFGSITRSFWSQTGDMHLCPVGTPTCSLTTAVSGLTLQWRDTTRLTLGLARQVNDWLTMTGAMTYDQGATRGFTSQSTVRSLTIGAVVRLGENADLNVNASYGLMAAGTVNTTVLPGGVPNPFGYTATYGHDRVTSVRAALTYRF